MVVVKQLWMLQVKRCQQLFFCKSVSGIHPFKHLFLLDAGNFACSAFNFVLTFHAFHHLDHALCFFTFFRR